MSEFVPRVTKGMVAESKRYLEGLPDICMSVAIELAINHPDFRAQLRAWAAEEMRGLVPSVEKPVTHGGTEECKADAFNNCRAEILANIERWEKQP